MLYPVRLIAQEPFGTINSNHRLLPSACFLETVHTLNILFDRTPAVLLPPSGKTTTLLYRDVTYLWRDIAQQVGTLGAWGPLGFFGTTQARETVALTFHLEGADLVARRSSASGREHDHLQGLGLRMEWRDRETAEQMAALAAAVPDRTPCCAILGQKQDDLEESGLLRPTPGSLFTYLAWEPVSPLELLQSLTAAHKVQLWRTLLEDGRQPLEFQWLWKSYYAQDALFLLEWELALEIVLEELDFQVERAERFFRMTGPDGRERRFDFARGGPAEKLFLKTLFPTDTK